MLLVGLGSPFENGADPLARQMARNKQTGKLLKRPARRNKQTGASVQQTGASVQQTGAGLLNHQFANESELAACALSMPERCAEPQAAIL
jgi:hypothetical protein